MLKWLALILLIAGVAAVIAGFRLDKVSSFDDGSFVNEMVLFITGGVLILIAVIALGVAIFLAI